MPGVEIAVKVRESKTPVLGSAPTDCVTPRPGRALIVEIPNTRATIARTPKGIWFPQRIELGYVEGRQQSIKLGFGEGSRQPKTGQDTPVAEPGDRRDLVIGQGEDEKAPCPPDR